MKSARQILTTLFSAYLLILMVMPCNDHPVPGVVKTAYTTAGEDHHNADGDIDICTPFCTCSTCVAAIVVQPSLEISLFIPRYSAREIPNFYKTVNSQFFGSIWQPPRLV